MSWRGTRLRESEAVLGMSLAPRPFARIYPMLTNKKQERKKRAKKYSQDEPARNDTEVQASITLDTSVPKLNFGEKKINGGRISVAFVAVHTAEEDIVEKEPQDLPYSTFKSTPLSIPPPLSDDQ